jgi:hypothetical protein
MKLMESRYVEVFFFFPGHFSNPCHAMDMIIDACGLAQVEVKRAGPNPNAGFGGPMGGPRGGPMGGPRGPRGAPQGMCAHEHPPTHTHT